jgi:CDP-diacylglycerol--glycerol-3-phosphate 3-phosphatidyltransferase
LYFHRQNQRNDLVIVATVIALAAGQIISYIRARAEALGVDAKVGIAERAERMLIIWGSLIVTGLGFNILPMAIYLLAVISGVTVVQRVLHVRKQLA